MALSILTIAQVMDTKHVDGFPVGLGQVLAFFEAKRHVDLHIVSIEGGLADECRSGAGYHLGRSFRK
jgi:hypothetical protein